MKQEEKSARSRQRILEAAMEEFSQKGYEGASLNSVWAKKGISKGIIYHHFKDKDELYLRCVEVCFNEMTSYLCSVQYTSENGKERIHKLLTIRQRFFHENPLLGNIFFRQY